MPIGMPRFSGGNHILMTLGAMTVIKPRPMPSIARPPNNSAGLVASAPTIDPSMVQPIAIRPAIFGPSLTSTKAAGMPSTMPATAKADISQPPVAMSMCRSRSKTCIAGGTLD